MGAEAKKINIIETADLLEEAWQKAANHEKLNFEEVNAIRAARTILDRIEKAGESSIKFYEERED